MRIGAFVLLLTLAAPVAAQRVAARDHVAAIYRAIPRRGFDYTRVHYAPALADLMARDTRFSAAAGEVGALNGVPFCDCQDNDTNYRIMRIVERAPLKGVTRVTIDLRNGAVGRFAVDLVRARSRWLVADIASPRTPSLLAYLRREVPREERDLQTRSR